MLLIARVSEIPRTGIRFTYKEGPFDEEGILLRLDSGEIRAYKNECRHLPMRLDDREPRNFWDASGHYLTCNSHGARYDPEDGKCVAGPCQGSHLKSLPIEIDDGQVFLNEDRVGGFFKV